MILGPERVEPGEEKMGVQRRTEESMNKATGLFLITCKGLKITAGQLQPKVQAASHVDHSCMSWEKIQIHTCKS